MKKLNKRDNEEILVENLSSLESKGISEIPQELLIDDFISDNDYPSDWY